MQLANIGFTKISMVLVTKAINTSLINWCLDGKTTFPHRRNTNRFNHASSIVDDFLLCKVLNLPRMPIEKGHSYGKVLQNQKKL